MFLQYQNARQIQNGFESDTGIEHALLNIRRGGGVQCTPNYIRRRPPYYLCHEVILVRVEHG